MIDIQQLKCNSILGCFIWVTWFNCSTGEIIGLVGAKWAGKSTLINLMLYD